MLGMPWVLRMERSIGWTSRRRWSTHYGRQPGGRMRFCGNHCPHRAPRLSDARWGDDRNVGDIRHVRRVRDTLLNRHSRSDHWGCAHHHRRRCPNGSWNNHPSARAWRRWNKDSIGTYRGGPHVARTGLTHRDVDIGRRRRVTGRSRPVTGDVDHQSISVLVIRRKPDVLRLRREHPAALKPPPSTIGPVPITADPNGTRIGSGWRRLGSHRRWRPPDGYRRRGLDRRLDIDGCLHYRRRRFNRNRWGWWKVARRRQDHCTTAQGQANKQEGTSHFRSMWGMNNAPRVAGVNSINFRRPSRLGARTRNEALLTSKRHGSAPSHRRHPPTFCRIVASTRPNPIRQAPTTPARLLSSRHASKNESPLVEVAHGSFGSRGGIHGGRPVFGKRSHPSGWRERGSRLDARGARRTTA